MPEVVNVGSQYDFPVRKPLHGSSSAANVLSSDCKTPSVNMIPVVDLDSGAIINSDDDFVPTTTKSGRIKLTVKKAKQAHQPRRKDAAILMRNVTSTKRAPKRPKKWCGSVEKLRPRQFPHLQSARLLRDFIISDYAKEKYKT